jgi:DNA-binding NtrC family response regulator
VNSARDRPARLCVVLSGDRSFVALVRAILDEAGVAVRGSQAWDDVTGLVRDLEPAVLALDLSVNQQEHCWSVLETLGADLATSALPVVVCAAAGWLLDGHAEELGRDGVHLWAEPFDPADLLATVEVALAPAERSRCG